MKNLKINWPAVIAIALAVSAVSYHNGKQAEKAREQQARDTMTRIEQTFEEAKTHIEGVELDQIIYPDEWQKEEKGFSK